MSDNVLNSPGLMDPSTEFGSMMQNAMKIKGHQMEQDRKKFETYPMFLQNTMWMQNEECLKLRELPVAERLTGAAKLKALALELGREQALRQSEANASAIAAQASAKRVQEAHQGA